MFSRGYMVLKGIYFDLKILILGEGMKLKLHFFKMAT